MVRVLLIEDELADILMLRRAAEQAHLSWQIDVIRETSRVLTGLVHLAERSPDLILLDINLPGINGLDLLPMLHKSCPHTPILVLTTSQNPSDQEMARSRGATGFYTKPLGYRALLSMLKEIDRFILRRPAPQSAQGDPTINLPTENIPSEKSA